jgi:hypothetical protein
MRPLATWLVVGGLAVLGLFAARDALRSAPAPASSARTTSSIEKRRRTPLAVVRPPQIAGKDRLATELQELGAGGVLYLTDANCRRYLLGLPGLLTGVEGLPGPDCTRARQVVVSERVGLRAEQVGAQTIEVSSEVWRFRFSGNDPVFTPEGVLTFLKDGGLYAWTVRCPRGVETTVFRGLHALERCARGVSGAPSDLREIVWLGGGDFAAVVGQEFASTLLVVRNGRPEKLFQAIGVRMGALQASPSGRDLAVRIGANLFVFDALRARKVPLPAGADQQTRAIAWSPDGRYAVVASVGAVHIYLARNPRKAVTLPLAMVGVEWR